MSSENSAAPIRQETHAEPPWFRRALAGACVLYLLLALLLIATRPGIHYDEASMVQGAIHMLKGAHGGPPFTYGPGYWIKAGDRFWPLMVIPYIGAARYYLTVPLFAAFGPSIFVIRLSSALLTVLGLWSLGRLAGERIGWHEGALAVALLSLHPSFVLHTVFDASGLALWFASLGLLAAALGAFVRVPGGCRACGLGVAAGFAVWCRLNILWLLFAAAVAIVAVGRRELWAHRKHVPAAALGAALGLAPVVAYQLISRFATVAFMRTWVEKDDLLAVVTRRLVAVAEMLVLDRESLLLWNGDAAPTWQLVVVAAPVLGALFWAFALRRPADAEGGRWLRGSAIALAVYLALLVSSRLLVRSHHLVTALPLVALLLAAAAVALARHSTRGRFLAAAGALALLSILLTLDARAFLGLHRTGGYWIWSDGLYTLSQELREHHSGERVSVLDWGFANGLYVKSAGAIDFVELFWSATERGPGDGRRWEEVVAAGGLFVRAAPGRASIATQGFERALAASGQAALRQEIRDRGGQLLAEIVVVSADRARPTSRSGASGQGARNP